MLLIRIILTLLCALPTHALYSMKLAPNQLSAQSNCTLTQRLVAKPTSAKKSTFDASMAGFIPVAIAETEFGKAIQTNDVEIIKSKFEPVFAFTDYVARRTVLAQGLMYAAKLSQRQSVKQRHIF